MSQALYPDTPADEWAMNLYRQGYPLSVLLRKQALMLEATQDNLRSDGLSVEWAEKLRAKQAAFTARINYIKTLQALGLSDIYAGDGYETGIPTDRSGAL